MRVIKATFENGDAIITQINGTEEEILKYYLNRTFNIGSVSDNMQKCVSVEFLDKKEK